MNFIEFKLTLKLHVSYVSFPCATEERRKGRREVWSAYAISRNYGIPEIRNSGMNGEEFHSFRCVYNVCETGMESL